MFMCLCDSCHKITHLKGIEQQSYLIPDGASDDFIEMQYKRLEMLTESNQKAIDKISNLQLIKG